tara:strand:+ start:5023 stop:6999 length:1977 start_codon:yes stop_codon:yes gene_type:complete
MSVLKGNISSVMRRRDNTLLDKLRAGYTDAASIRNAALAEAKDALGTIGSSADDDVNLALSQAQTKDEVQNILGNLSPLADKGTASTAGDARTLGLLNEEKLRTANIISDIGAKDVLEGYQNKITIKKELGELAQFTPGTPEYKAKAEELHQRNLATGTPDKAITDIYDQEFGNADITVSPDTIQAAVGVGVDMTNPSNFGKAAHDRAVSTISDRLEAQWPGIRDKSVFDKRAKDLLSKSEWGQNFDRQTKLEAGETTQSVRLKERSAAIANAISLQDPDLVDAEVNKTLNFLQANNITGPEADVFNKNVELALDRSKVDPAAVFENAEYGGVDYKTAKKISPMQASLLIADLKETYRKKYPNLPDRLLDPQIAKVIKNNQALGYAISEGKKDAAFQSNLDSDFREAAQEYKAQQHKALFNMAQHGTKTYIADRLTNKLTKLKFKSGDSISHEDANEISRETAQVVDRIKGFFKDEKGRFLPGASKQTLAAFRLAVSKAIIGNAGIDEDSLPFDGNDLVFSTLNRYRQMSDTSDYELLNLFVEALPDSQRSIKTNRDGDVNVTEGINRFTEFAQGRLADAQSQDLGRMSSGWRSVKTSLNSLGANFDRLKPIPVSNRFSSLTGTVNVDYSKINTSVKNAKNAIMGKKINKGNSKNPYQ